MRTEEPRAIHLADYKAPDFHIETVHLDFALDPEVTRVTAKLRIVRKTFGSSDQEPVTPVYRREQAKPASGFPSGRATQKNNAALMLHGEDLKLISLALDGKALP